MHRLRRDSNAGFRRTAADAYSPRPLTDGERWTVEALLELRQGGYRFPAWLRFVSRSLERSSRARQSAPRLARQARGWGVIGAAGWLAVCHLGSRRPSLSFNPTAGLLWWLSVWQMLDWHLGMAEGDDGVPHDRLSSADALTLTRFWLVPLLPAVRRSRFGLSAVIAIGGLTDWLDGVLARRHGRTRLGRDLDSTADLAFLCTAAACARAAGRLSSLGAWSLGLRYSLGVSVALAAFFGRARRPAIGARRLGAPLRVGGLTLATGGLQRAGTTVLVIGCLVPARPTAPHLTPA